jgi:hypothetical protein
MSANRDKSQKIAFVYSNLYQLYRKGKDAATAAPDAPGLTTGRIIKAEDAAKAIANPADSGIKIRPFSLDQDAPAVRPYQPVEFIAKRVEKSQTALKVAQNPTIDSLKDNLKTLNELHERLQFMLKELEDLVKED